ncbi:hypothetical protein GCM10022295_89310 [Streptomyces osmaniensis]|uniref:Uncharacterized protein n=1 Tax=Streptomyces osmaniensis TaxID=593134 RepID=A0ABP6Z0J1_9ACTN
MTVSVSGVAPAVGLPEDELATVPGWSALGVREPWWDSSAQNAVGSHPGQHLDRQVFEEEAEARCVVSGVGNDEDDGVACLPLSLFSVAPDRMVSR